METPSSYDQKNLCTSVQARSRRFCLWFFLAVAASFDHRPCSPSPPLASRT